MNVHGSSTTIVLPVVALLVIVGCGGASSSDSAAAEPERTRLETAFDGCSRAEKRTVEVADQGNTIIVDTGSSSDIFGAVCIFSGLDTPSSIMSAVQNTNSLMGMQQADDGDLHYSWSYHPDNGLNLVVTDGAAAE